MRKIDKSIDNLLSTKYKQWLNKSTADGNVPDGTNRYYYDELHPAHIVLGPGRSALIGLKFKF